MFKKKKENKQYFEEKSLLLYDREFLGKMLRRLYPVGSFVDQTSAYKGLGNKRIEIKDNIVSISGGENNSINVSIGGTGIWHSSYKKLAKKVI